MMIRRVWIVLSCVGWWSVAAQGAGLVVERPVENQVFQRVTAKAGVVVVQVRGSELGEGVTVEGRLVGKARDGVLSEAWERVPRTAEGEFRAEMVTAAGGWYRLEVRAMRGHKMAAEAAVEHVGVGEVFVVGGQSNSTCFGEKRQATATGMVSSFDGEKWTIAADPLPGVDGKGGSIWPLFGDAMEEKYGVPIGIVPVGAGSTSVRQWLPAGERVEIAASTTRALKQVGEHSWECDGRLFDRMVARMKAMGPHGFRAMLWHQGESDANQQAGRTLPGESYRKYMEEIIAGTRTQAGWTVPWFVAQATYHKPTDTGSADIRAAQKALWEEGVAMEGPDTDTLQGDNRDHGGQGVHMSDTGLHAHADLWVGKVGIYLDGELEGRRVKAPATRE